MNNEHLTILVEEIRTNTEVLLQILFILNDMKEQEKRYWETWKQNKEKELKKID